MNQELVYVTGNPKKAKFFARIVTVPYTHQALELEEIQSLDFEEIVEHKVRQAYEAIKKPVVVGDNGLILHALGKLPGPLVKWFMESLGEEGLCRLLDRYDDRSAMAVTCLGYYDGTELKIFKGERPGRIANQPSTAGDWPGWNNIFIPEGFDKPWPELSEKDQNEQASTWQALQQLETYLKSR
jgi:non-canonical purine NTP pyrophosphatase (RdgB/HAM1 family)